MRKPALPKGGYVHKARSHGGDLVRFAAALKVDCCHCGYGRTLDGAEVVKAAGSGALKGLYRRFRCQRCGMKQAGVAVLPPV